jgi:hypothetical protein
VSKGSRDEVLVWNYQKSTETKPHVEQVFEWPDENVFGYGGTIIGADDGKLAVLGALKSIRVYNLGTAGSKSLPVKRNQVGNRPKAPLNVRILMDF